MEIRSLGQTGLNISLIGLGCVTFGREIDRDQSFRILDLAFEKGINFFDTAEAYFAEGGEERSSEWILGQWMRSRGCRDQVVVQSKISEVPKREHLFKALERSLNRLGLECLDVYLLHSYSERTQLDELGGAMTDVRRSSRIRAYGCSNFTLPQMQSLIDCCERHDFERPGTIEPVYNLVCRSEEDCLFPFCRREGIGITTYSPLGAGFLTGKYTRDAGQNPPGSRFAIKPNHRQIYCTEHGFQVLHRLEAAAKSSQIAMSKLALGWALANRDVDSVLIGATCTSHVRNAVDVVEHPISAELISALNMPEARSCF